MRLQLRSDSAYVAKLSLSSCFLANLWFPKSWRNPPKWFKRASKTKPTLWMMKNCCFLTLCIDITFQCFKKSSYLNPFHSYSALGTADTGSFSSPGLTVQAQREASGCSQGSWTNVAARAAPGQAELLATWKWPALRDDQLLSLPCPFLCLSIEPQVECYLIWPPIILSHRGRVATGKYREMVQFSKLYIKSTFVPEIIQSLSCLRVLVGLGSNSASASAT